MVLYYRFDLTDSGAHQTHPVVRGLCGEGRDVAEHVIDLRTVVTAVESVATVVTHSAPLSLLPLLDGRPGSSLHLHLPPGLCLEEGGAAQNGGPRLGLLIDPVPGGGDLVVI